jgi:DNA-binding transcriptional LysR family regulator
VDRLFAQNRMTPDILMEVSNAEFIKQLVQRGDGVSFLVRESVAAELADRRLAEVSLQERTIYLDVSIAYLENQQLSPPALAFLDTLDELQFGRELTPQGIGAYMARILSRQKSP